ncbi:hypothetical protein ACI3LY_004513 [Candidozyma auris]|uniref:RFX-type winged-helix domain-containing protein n=1 Tax=Candidozyma auris TaxID=498019 RepID=A0A2H0ZD40_CANAR|nr:hypothetical_protein [[Candida] auris]PIS48548.1 hypothetical protein B9J08_005242 [[Candida] auris]PIS49159.1 hypothetical protein CJI97_005324 [[Candida] auris]QEO23138.1 hypothetical_protein [[Candida] auris]GBL49187.1 hypothetical protein CAJCM15448_14610 [[Candida] auris]
MIHHQQSSVSSAYEAQPTQSKSNVDVLQSLLTEVLNVDAFNLNSFLLSFLRKIDHSLPLDDFYNILYNPMRFDDLRSLPSIDKVDKTFPSDSFTSTISIIQRVLEAFRSPESYSTHVSSGRESDMKSSNVNFHELLRSLLAIKILDHSLIEVDSSDTKVEYPPIPRLDIYKVYYILCQKLILKYPTSSNSTSLQQKLIFGQSKLGKLIKLVYPNLVSKRLGRRGESRYNYLGVRWNQDVVDKEITKLCESELFEIAEMFKVSKKTSGSAQSRSSRHQRTLEARSTKKRYSTDSLRPENLEVKAQGTFVEPHHFFPKGAFTSKAYLDEKLNENIEKNWFAATLKLSSDALLSLGVSSAEINGLIFDEGSSSDTDDHLLRGVIDTLIPKLLGSPDQPRIYLHLYMVISLNVFPHLLSLRKPLHTDSIKRLFSRVTYLIQNMETEMVSVAGEKMRQQDIRNFLGILSRMIHLNKLLAAFFKADLQAYILMEMQEDIVRILNEGSKDGPNETHRLISEACISVTLACRYKPQFRGVPVRENIREFLSESCHIMEKMVSEDLAQFVSNIMESGVPSTREDSHDALKFRFLLATLKLVDEGILNENMKSRFPAQVIRGFYSRVTIQILQFTYRAHASMLGGRTLSPANPTFRLWYVLESFIQEYLDVLAELNSLHLKTIE